MPGAVLGVTATVASTIVPAIAIADVSLTQNGGLTHEQDQDETCLLGPARQPSGT